MRSFDLAFDAIGTKWLINCYEASGTKLKEEIENIILNRIEEFDKTYSRFRKDSIVWKISQKKGEYIFPKDDDKLFDLYEKLYKITNGAFTLLIGNVLDQAGYDSNYSLTPREINKIPKESDVFSYSSPILKIRKPFILDFGGLGKGYLIDILCGILVENGVVSFCIDGGGDIFYKTRNSKPLTVGLENPDDKNQVIGIVKILNQSICASSGNRRKWDKFHHIINPHTLKSPSDVKATWVIAKDALTADAMATCLFLEKPERLLKYFDFEYLIMFPDNLVKSSKNFNAELFFKN